MKMKEQKTNSATKKKKKTKAAKKSSSNESVLIVKHNPERKWFQHQINETGSNESSTIVSTCRLLAKDLLDKDVQVFEQMRHRHSGSESNWLQTVSQAGTTADKQAAFTINIQQSPIHALKYIDSLISAISKKERRTSMISMDTLKSLFIEELLPADRKLLTFEMRPLTEWQKNKDEKARNHRFVLWYFEDQLKVRYQDFVVAIEKLCHDTVDANRTHAIRTIYELLNARPEQEKLLLTSLVNKLGDNKYKVASKVCEILSKLVQNHSNMRQVVVKEVERLIYRPNIQSRAQFYGLCFLSQLMLNAGENQLAMDLLSIYFGLFQVLIKKGEIDNRMLNVLLTGTNRAFPYAKGNLSSQLKHMETLYKLVAVAPLGIALQTLMLLLQVLQATDGLSDRYYSALYRRMLDPGLSNSGRLNLLMNLVYKTMLADAVDNRVKAFIKRLLQLATNQSAAFAAAALILVSNLLEQRPDVIRMHKTAEAKSLDEDEDEKFYDIPSPDEKIEKTTKEKDEKSKASWVHIETQTAKSHHLYDPTHRNPLFAGAQATLEYELLALAKHYHPTVALFARNVLRNRSIQYDGDPLSDLSSMRFLDRFVYRNPKESKKSAESGVKRLKSYDPWGAKKLSVGSEEYIKMEQRNVPVDEKFLHRFVSQSGVNNQKGNESDGESVDSDLFDTVIERFEPGAANDEFEIDLSTVNRNKKRKRKVDADWSDEDEEGHVTNSAQQFSQILEDASEAAISKEKPKVKRKRPRGYRKFGKS